MRKRSLAAVASMVALSGALALPASAGVPDAKNTITIGLTSGGLFATASDSARSLTTLAPPSLATATDDVTYTVALQNFAVGDARRGTLPWVATVAISDLKVDGDTTKTLLATTATLVSATVAQAGQAVTVLTPSVTPSAADASMPLAKTTSEVGNNSYSWSSTLNIVVPPTALVGTYTGTITNSVV